MWCYLQDVGTEAATATCRPCDLATLLTLIADFCTVGPQTWSVKYFRLTSIWENHSQLDFYFPYGLKPIISFRRGMFGRSSGTKLCFLCFRVSCLCWCWWWWGWWWRRPFCAKHVVHAHATWRCIVQCLFEQILVSSVDFKWQSGSSSRESWLPRFSLWNFSQIERI